MENEDKKNSILEAGKHILLWRKIYNALCRSCKYKLVRAGSDVNKVGPDVVTDRMAMLTDNLCPRCKEMKDKMLERYNK